MNVRHRTRIARTETDLFRFAGAVIATAFGTAGSGCAQAQLDAGAGGASSSYGGNAQGAGGRSGTGGRVTSAAGAGAGGALTALTPCDGLVFEQNAQVAGGGVDRFTWPDSNCAPRSASMARTGKGYLRQFTYQRDGKTLTATGTGTNGWNGWGYAINHGLGGGGSDAGRFGTVFVGAHHAVYEYVYDVSSSLPVTIDWFFATGRDNPVVAITYDMTARSPGINADTRTPYGDLAWDGDENWQNTVVSGVGWGDRYVFVTTHSPLSLNSTWDYTQKNLVPYCMEWADASDSEMGAVQTQTYLQHDGGGYWGYRDWGKTSANQTRDATQLGQMPPADSRWAYQLNQYEMCYPAADNCLSQTTHSHRLAWGANYGAVGGTDANGKYPAFGDDKQLSGYPYQSYSVFMVLGKHSAKTVLAQVHEIEVVQSTALTASVGSVLTEGPGGVGRSDTVKFAPAGYDHRYSTWNLEAAGNRAEFQVVVGKDSLQSPIVVLSNYTATSVPVISIDGRAAVADTDVFASVDSANHTLWITFRRGWSGTRRISVG